MIKDPMLYVLHILDSIEKINIYIQEGEDILIQDQKTYDAVIRNLQTLSEATAHLDQDFKSSYPDLEWNKITGFRNILVHDYLGKFDPEIIQNVIDIYLPKLRSSLLEYYTDKIPNNRHK